MKLLRFLVVMVKGNITEQMDIEVDWAFAAASTAYILACRLDLLKCDLTPNEIKTLARLAPTPSSKHSRSQSRYTIWGKGVREEGKQKPVGGFGSSRISPTEITDRVWGLP